MSPQYPLIPAKAGTQLFCAMLFARMFWIPAFAGTSGWEEAA